MKKVVVELELCDDFYRDLENVAKVLHTSVEWLIKQELRYDFRDIQMWIQRASILRDYGLL